MVHPVNFQQRKVDVQCALEDREKSSHTGFSVGIDHVLDYGPPLAVGDDDVFRSAAEGTEVPKGLDAAGEYPVAQSGIVIVGRVYVSILSKALIEPGRHLADR